TLARLVAQGLLGAGDVEDAAGRTGYAPERVLELVQVLLTTPGMGELREMLNRGTVTETQARHAFAKHQIEPQFWDALVKLALEILDPSQLAAAIHRGLIPDPGLLKGEQPSGPRNVEAYPVYPIDALKEAKGSGYDRDRLGVLVGLQGL